MTAIRRAAVAGMFYPGDARQLRKEVRGFLKDAGAPDRPVPKAIIAPHAGYRYSGAVAASAYALLKPAAGIIKRVILMGPCHRVAVRGIARSGADSFETPLGRVEIDQKAETAIARLPHVETFPPTHQQEHALEVHLPFLQEVLGEFKLVPLVVGESSPAEVARVLETLWGGPETLIVISSDLSHYLDYDSARAIDKRTCDAISNLNPASIERNGACGRFPIGGLLHLAKTRGMRVETLDLRNSGDTAGSKDKVVGYGSWALYEPEESKRGKPITLRINRPNPRPGTASIQPNGDAAADFERRTKDLLAEHGDRLLKLANASILHGLRTGAPRTVEMSGVPEPLKAAGACFVTLKSADKQLRGCIGSPTANRPLALDVSDNAFRAAFKDPRFRPVTEQEYPTLGLSISVLSPQATMSFTDEADLLRQLRPGIDGLVIADGPRRALFLPSVWEQLPDPRLFLTHLKKKAGMSADHWSTTFAANRFIAEEVGGQPPDS